MLKRGHRLLQMGRKDERGWRTPISRWDSGTAPPLHSIGFGPSAPLAVGVGSALLMPVWGVPPFQQTNWGQPSVAAGVPGVPVCPGRHCWALTSEAPIPFRARAAQRWTPPRDGGGPPPPRLSWGGWAVPQAPSWGHSGGPWRGQREREQRQREAEQREQAQPGREAEPERLRQEQREAEEELLERQWQAHGCLPSDPLTPEGNFSRPTGWRSIIQKLWMNWACEASPPQTRLAVTLDGFFFCPGAATVR